MKTEIIDYEFRLRAIELLESGLSRYAVAKELGIDQYSVRNWHEAHNNGTLEKMKDIPLRVKQMFDIDELKSYIALTEGKTQIRLKRLLRVAEGEKIKDVAVSEGVSPQSIMADKRLYFEGRLPSVIII